MDKRLPIDLANAERPIGDRPPRSYDSLPAESIAAIVRRIRAAAEAPDLGMGTPEYALDTIIGIVREVTGA